MKRRYFLFPDRCPKCDGTVGPHSDICLDCGYDTAQLSLLTKAVALFIGAILALLVAWSR